MATQGASGRLSPLRKNSNETTGLEIETAIKKLKDKKTATAKELSEILCDLMKIIQKQNARIEELEKKNMDKEKGN